MRTVITLFLTLTTLITSAQTMFGGGLELEDNDLGIQLRADIPVSKVLSIDPYLTYFFPDKLNFHGVEFKVTYTSIGSDLHYNFKLGDKFSLYPLVGVSYDMYRYKGGFGDDKGGELHFNLGGGAAYSISDDFKLYAEPRYRGQIEGVSFDVGVLFSFGSGSSRTSNSSTTSSNNPQEGSLPKNCKPAVSKIDEFTEQEVIAWGGKLGTGRNMFQGVSQSVALHIGDVDGKQIIDMTVQYQQKENDASVNEIDIPKGSEFMVKTTGGILTFVAEKSQRIKRKMMGYNVTVVSLIAEISVEQVQKLANNPITMYRIVSLETEAIKGDVNSSKAQKLRGQFKCYLETKQ